MIAVLMALVLFAQSLWVIHSAVHAMVFHDHCEMTQYAPTSSCVLPDAAPARFLHASPLQFNFADLVVIFIAVPTYFSIRAPPVVT